jgi:hypothetical protein
LFRFHDSGVIVGRGLSSSFGLLPAPISFRHSMLPTEVSIKASEASPLLMRHPI